MNTSATLPTMVTVLEQEVYTELEAARLLNLAPSTLRYWLRGGTVRGVDYMPILRPEPTGDRAVLWAEFIEAGWLRAYRRQNVPMRELRRFIELLRDGMGVPYPLATKQPFLAGKKLVFYAQEAAELDPYWRMVDEQLVLTHPSELFMERVLWEGDLAAGWRPAAESASTVVVRPDVRFGRPAVGGISTEVIYDAADEGASRQEIADDFGVSVADVRWAISFEEARQAA